MGIRYYAYPIDHRFLPIAHSTPEALLTNDHFIDAWTDANPQQCYLDKAWGPLQELFGERPAMQLLGGAVKWRDIYCYEPWFGVLNPEVMPEVLQNLSDVTADDVRAFEKGAKHQFFEFDYVWQYLVRARDHVRRWAREGLGAVYLIG